MILKNENKMTRDWFDMIVNERTSMMLMEFVETSKVHIF